MNRIVRDHYPVSKLPEDLREGFAPDDEVRVTIDVVPEVATDTPSDTGFLARSRHLRRRNFASDAEVDDHVRQLRDEWSDRER